MTSDPAPIVARAVIVGVENYEAIDPTGTSDLPSARLDALGWLRYCLRDLKMRPKHIRLLMSPPLSKSERKAMALFTGCPERKLPKAHPPTSGELEKAFTKLGNKLRRSTESQTALFAYSGHGLTPTWGDRVAEGLALGLAPQDIHRDGEALENAVLFATIEHWLRDIGANNQLVSMLDCCYTELAAHSDLHEQLQTFKQDNGPLFRGATMLASELWQPSMIIDTAEGPRGAMSWSLQTLLPQWTTQSIDGVGYLNASYGNLLFRCRQLMSSMGIDQAPTLVGDARFSMVPVFYPIRTTTIPTASAPDRVRREAELFEDETFDGFMSYELYLNDASDPANHVCSVTLPCLPNTTGVDINHMPGVEQWAFNETMPQIQPTDTLVWKLAGKTLWSTSTLIPSGGSNFKAEVSGHQIDWSASPGGVAHSFVAAPGSQNQALTLWVDSQTAKVTGLTFYTSASNFEGNNGFLQGMSVGDTQILQPGAIDQDGTYARSSVMQINMGADPVVTGVTPDIGGQSVYYMAARNHQGNTMGPIGPWLQFLAQPGSTVSLANIMVNDEPLSNAPPSTIGLYVYDQATQPAIPRWMKHVNGAITLPGSTSA